MSKIEKRTHCPNTGPDEPYRNPDVPTKETTKED